MKLEHIAIWVRDLEGMREFYTRYFNMNSNDKYVNPAKGYSSYFLSFPGSDTRIELMHRPDISEYTGNRGMTHGLAHISISIGSSEKVDELTEILRREGYKIAGEPRTTGDGYYESVVLDPEGNYLEISD